jgi:hypothetical protein
VAEGKENERDRNERDAPGKETEPLLESKGADVGSGGITAPKKPDKPPKKPPRNVFGASSSNNNSSSSSSGVGLAGGAGAPTNTSRDEVVANDASRAQQGPPRASWFAFLGKSMCCKMGYRMEPFYRDANLEGHYIADSRNDAFVVAAVIQNIFASAAFVTGLVRPAVRVHCVYIDSGMYVKGPGMPAAPPLVTGA